MQTYITCPFAHLLANPNLYDAAKQMTHSKMYIFPAICGISLMLLLSFLQVQYWSLSFISTIILPALHFVTSPPLVSLLLSNFLLSASSRGSRCFSLIDWFCQTPISTVQGQGWEKKYV